MDNGVCVEKNVIVASRDTKVPGPKVVTHAASRMVRSVLPAGVTCGVGFFSVNMGPRDARSATSKCASIYQKSVRPNVDPAITVNLLFLAITHDKSTGGLPRRRPGYVHRVDEGGS